MNTYYLTFPSERKGRSLLLPLFGIDGELAEASESHALHIIGTLYEESIPTEEGAEPEAPTALSGWHVNLRYDSELPESLRPFETYPKTPSVVWL
ncbi:hypothetical protein D3C76_897700 [compost metagenome]